MTDEDKRLIKSQTERNEAVTNFLNHLSNLVEIMAKKVKESK